MIVIFVPDDVMALGLEFGSWGILPSRCVEGVGQKKVRSRPAGMGLLVSTPGLATRSNWPF
jgi:hypothetical protein